MPRPPLEPEDRRVKQTIYLEPIVNEWLLEKQGTSKQSLSMSSLVNTLLKRLMKPKIEKPN